jgi:hypothetical protein
MMKAIFFSLALAFGLPAVAAPECKAILPLAVFSIMDNYVNVDGTLLLDGQSQCTVVNIECRREFGTCSDAFSDIMFAGGMPQISRITRVNFNIIKWANGELVASGEAGLCGWTEIYINLTNKDVTITTRSTTARPGCEEAGKSELFRSLVNGKTQVFHVGSDPFWNRRSPQ